MTHNMGQADRVVRVVAAVLVGVFYLLGALTGPVALALGLLALVLVSTAVVGFCPLYMVLGLKTTREPLKPVR